MSNKLDATFHDGRYTDCGKAFEHPQHPYKTPRGKIKICDGVFRAKKEGHK